MRHQQVARKIVSLSAVRLNTATCYHSLNYPLSQWVLLARLFIYSACVDLSTPAVSEEFVTCIQNKISRSCRYLLEYKMLLGEFLIN